MKIIYFDCFSGISGDMIISAFIDSGFDYSFLKSELSKLDVDGYFLSSEKCVKNGLSATKFRVTVNSDQHHRSLTDIKNIINSSSLHPEVKKNAVDIFNILGEAEALIHNTDIDNIHFHEIGAIDSIIDICGAAVCFHHYGACKVLSSPINTGSGFVKTAHGTLPVPAPATAEILKGIPVYSNGIKAELTTPTGAAIIKHYSSGFTPLPEIVLETTGYGAGEKNLAAPNVLRLITGSDTSGLLYDEVAEIEASIDDMNPELYSYLFEILFSEGALDVAVIPSVMKKNRPGNILKILSTKDKADRLADTVFRETTTSGLRINMVKRRKLEREFRTVQTRYGTIKIKIHTMNGIPVTVSPEYEDCRNAASQSKAALKDVYSEALMAAQTFF